MFLTTCSNSGTFTRLTIARGGPPRKIAPLPYRIAHIAASDATLSQLLGLTQSSVSHQLRLLRSWRLVKSRRAGKHIYYVADDHHIVALFEQGLEHVQERTAGGRAEHVGAPARRAGDKRRSAKRVAHPAAPDASGPSPSSRGTRL